MKLWLLSALLLLGSWWFSDSQAAPRLVNAPSFVLQTRDSTVSSDSLRGKVVLVDFWASWCVPCRRSFPWLETMHERYGTKGLAIVAIDLDKSREAASEFLNKYPASFTVAFDPTGKTAEAFHVAGLPSSYLIAPDGSILHSSTGFDSKTATTVEKLIQEACSQ